MGVFLTSSVRDLASTFLLVSISLFFIGPQLGSLDADCDGIPETPVIVSTALSKPDLSSMMAGMQRPILVPRSSSPTPVLMNASVHGASVFVSPQESVAPTSFPLLR